MFQTSNLTKSNQLHLPKSVIVEDFPTRTDVAVIKLTPSLLSRGKQKYHFAKNKADNKQIRKNRQIKQNKTSSPLLYAFIEETINIGIDMRV